MGSTKIQAGAETRQVHTAKNSQQVSTLGNTAKHFENYLSRQPPLSRGEQTSEGAMPVGSLVIESVWKTPLSQRATPTTAVSRNRLTSATPPTQEELAYKTSNLLQVSQSQPTELVFTQGGVRKMLHPSLTNEVLNFKKLWVCSHIYYIISVAIQKKMIY